jgi:transposase-like protein/DNA-directed RNA polymerase subunit M/transcription elongation factor TFIIS
MLSLEELQQRREEKASKMVSDNVEIKQVDESVYQVPSQTEKGKAYQVVNVGEEWECECPDNQFRLVQCKHIIAVKLWKLIKAEIEETEEILCPKCGNAGIKKSGIRKNKFGEKQRYECLVCGKRFVKDLAFKGLKADRKTIALALDLFYKGVSQRKIKDTLEQFMGVEVSQPTINRWIQRFTRLINKYAETLKPQVGDTWNVDELKMKQHGEWKWVWSVLDKETRFWLADHISTERKVSDARIPFAKAKEVAEKNPQTIVTDGLHAYKQAFNKEFFTLKKPRTEHVSHIKLSGDMNNNIAERLNGTIREREKVTRNLKEQAPTIIEGYRNYYNLVRPHQSLNGKTPAETANIDLGLGKNKWLSIIKKSVKSY